MRRGKITLSWKNLASVCLICANSELLISWQSFTICAIAVSNSSTVLALLSIEALAVLESKRRKERRDFSHLIVSR